MEPLRLLTYIILCSFCIFFVSISAKLMVFGDGRMSCEMPSFLHKLQAFAGCKQNGGFRAGHPDGFQK